MSENAPATETIEIPGKLQLSNPVPQPIIVRLPIVAWPSQRKNALFGLLALLFGASFVLTSVLIVLGLPQMSLSALDVLMVLVVLPLSLLMSSFAGAGLTCLWDAIRNGPVLEITSEGLCDYRSGLSVAWSAIRSAKILYGTADGFGGVDIELRGPVTNWQNPFRIGVLFFRYRPKPDHVIVSVAYLDTPAHVLAYTILTLTQWNGSEVFSKLPSGLEMYPRLIPRRVS